MPRVPPWSSFLAMRERRAESEGWTRPEPIDMGASTASMPPSDPA